MFILCFNKKINKNDIASLEQIGLCKTCYAIFCMSTRKGSSKWIVACLQCCRDMTWVIKCLGNLLKSSAKLQQDFFFRKPMKGKFKKFPNKLQENIEKLLYFQLHNSLSNNFNGKLFYINFLYYYFFKISHFMLILFTKFCFKIFKVFYWIMWNILEILDIFMMLWKFLVFPKNLKKTYMPEHTCMA